MIKMKIIIDENKVNEEDKYSLTEIYSKLDKLFTEKGILARDEEGYYKGSNNKNDFANFGIIMWGLKDCDWFTKNVEEWKWYVDGEIEDLIIHYKLKEVA